MDHNLVINIIILLGIIFSIFYQKNKIDALKTEVQSSKNIIDEMKSYMDIIKIDELKKYVAVKEETVKLEEQQKRKELVKTAIESVKRIATQTAEDSGKDTVEMIRFCIVLIAGVDPEYREDIIKEGIKNEMVKNYLLDANKTIGDSRFADGFIQLDFLKAIEGKPSLSNAISKAPVKK